MSLTRRELMHAAVASTALLPARMLQGSPLADRAGVTLFLHDDNCLARESAAGYRRALDETDHGHTIIVPAISTLSWSTATALRTKAEAGQFLILESAFTFADANLAEYQCRLIHNVFGLPVELHQERMESTTSYLQYRWPVEVLVRSFGQPIYIRNGDHHPMAHHSGNRTVAARRSMGRGQVTFLGSPLGPLLLAEDREATLLVRRIIAESV